MPVRGMRGSWRAFHYLRPTYLSRRLGFRRLNCPNPWRRFADTTLQYTQSPSYGLRFCVTLVCRTMGTALCVVRDTRPWRVAAAANARPVSPWGQYRLYTH